MVLRDDINYQAYGFNKASIYGTYAKGTFEQGLTVGYITGPIADWNKFALRYSVYIPDTGVTYHEVGLAINDYRASSNNTGSRPMPLKIGAPVLIAMTGNGNIPIIISSVYLPGALGKQFKAGKLPEMDSLDQESSLYTPPYNPAGFETNFDGAMSVDPLIIRNANPSQPEGSPANTEIPGNTVYSSATGMKAEFSVGSVITSQGNVIETNDGVKYGLADMPGIELAKEYARVSENIQAKLDMVYYFQHGKVTPGPAIVATTSQATRDIINSTDRLLGSVYNSLTELSETAISINDTITKQIDWRQEITKTFMVVVNRWKIPFSGVDFGIFKVNGSVGLNGSVDLWVDFNTSVPWLDSVLNDVITDRLSKFFNFNVLDGLFGIKFQGEGPTPEKTILLNSTAPWINSEKDFLTNLISGSNLASEIMSMINVIEAKGYKLLDLLSIIDGKFSGVSSDAYLKDLVELIKSYTPNEFEDLFRFSEAPTIDVSSRPAIPYAYILPTNKFNFSNNPHEAVAGLLARNGVEDSMEIATNVNNLLKSDSLVDYLDTLILLVDGEEKLVMITNRFLVSRDVGSLEDYLHSRYSDLDRCHETFKQFETYIGYVDRRPDYVIQADIKDSFYLDNLPDYTNWIADTQSIVEYLDRRAHPAAPAADYLNKGELTDFFNEVIKLSSGESLKTYPLKYKQLNSFVEKLQ